MEWQRLLEPEIQDYIRAHENAEVAALALKKPLNSDWPMPLIFDQIKSRQKARVKIPAWLERDNIILPAPDTLEQASSAATAHYKAGLVNGESFADLTAGAGVDTFALAANFPRGIAIDIKAQNAAILKHNAKVLGHSDVGVHCAGAEDFIKDMPQVDLVMIDPQRRSSARKGLYRLEDCQPDILGLLPALREVAGTILLKASPMADIAETCRALGSEVSAVHIIEYQGDCKEVLFLLNTKASTPFDDIPITAAQLDEKGEDVNSLTFTLKEEQQAQIEISPPKAYIYEPAPCLMKSGAFKTLAARYSLTKLHAHTHLYTSDKLLDTFIGRRFKLESVLPVNRKALPVSRASISVRNFPSTPEELRSKLKIKDGGESTLMACTFISDDGAEKKGLLHLQRT